MTHASPDKGGFSSLAELQRTHAALVKEVGKNLRDADNRSRIAHFILRSVATGGILDAKDDRAAAQSLINFWVAQLATAARETKRERSEKGLWSPTPGAKTGARPEATAHVAGGHQEGHRAQESVPELEDTLLQEFVPQTIDRSIVLAEATLGKLSKEQLELARRILLRLIRLAPEGKSFSPFPTPRAALQELDTADKALKDILQELQNAGVIRVTRQSSSAADIVELRNESLVAKWDRYKEWQEERLGFRKRVKQWEERGRPDAELLSGNELQEVLTYHDCNSLEKQFTDRCRSLQEAALQTVEQLRLVERAAQFNSKDKSTYLNREETAIAEGLLDRPKFLQYPQIVAKLDQIKYFTGRSRAHWDNEEKRRLNRKIQFLIGGLIFFGLFSLAILGCIIYIIGQDAKLRDANTETKQAFEFAKELMEVQNRRYQILRATPIVETDPQRYLAMASEAFEIAKVKIGEWDPSNVKEEEAPNLQDLRKKLFNNYVSLRREAIACLNLSLQSDHLRFILEPKSGEAYEVNGVAVNKDASLLASACSDGYVRVWSLEKEDVRYRRAIPIPKYKVTQGTEKSPAVLKVAFGGPQGRWLAIACSQSGVFVCFQSETEKPELTKLPLAQPARGSWTRVAWSVREPWLLAATAEKDDSTEKENNLDELPMEGGLHSWIFKNNGGSFMPTPIRVVDQEGKKLDTMTAVTFGLSEKGTHLYSMREVDGQLLAWEFQGDVWNAKKVIFAHSELMGTDWNKSPSRCTCLTSGLLQAADAKVEKTVEVLFAGKEDYNALLWEVDPNSNSGKEARLTPLLALRHNCPVRGVAVSPVRNLLATAGRDTKVRFWRINKRQLFDLPCTTDWPIGDADVTTLAGHKSKLSDLTFWSEPTGLSEALPDRSNRTRTDDDSLLYLASAGDDSTVRLWNVSPRRGPITDLGFSAFAHFSLSPDLGIIAGCDREPNDALLRPMFRILQDGAIRPHARNVQSAIRRVAFHPDGRRWASLDQQTTFRLWSGEGDLLTTTEVPPKDEVKELQEPLVSPIYGQIRFGTVGRLVAFAFTQDRVWVYDLTDPRQPQRKCASITKTDLEKWCGDTSLAVYDFVLDEKNERLALACSKGFVVLLDLKKLGKPLAGHTDGKPANLRTWSIEGQPAVNALSFSHDGQLLACGCADASIHFIDIPAGKLEKLNQSASTDDLASVSNNQSKGHISEVRRICFHPLRSDEFASGGDDGLLFIWKRSNNAKDWSQLYRFETKGIIQALRYDRQGDRLGVATAKGQVRVFWFNETDLAGIASERRNRTRFASPP